MGNEQENESRPPNKLQLLHDIVERFADLTHGQALTLITILDATDSATLETFISNRTKARRRGHTTTSHVRQETAELIELGFLRVVQAGGGKFATRVRVVYPLPQIGACPKSGQAPERGRPPAPQRGRPPAPNRGTYPDMYPDIHPDTPAGAAGVSVEKLVGPKAYADAKRRLRPDEFAKRERLIALKGQDKPISASLVKFLLNPKQVIDFTELDTADREAAEKVKRGKARKDREAAEAAERQQGERLRQQIADEKALAIEYVEKMDPAELERMRGLIASGMSPATFAALSDADIALKVYHASTSESWAAYYAERAKLRSGQEQEAAA